MRASMRGFQALPAPGTKPWWEVLGISELSNREAIEAAYRTLARDRHPDRPGGSHDMMADLNWACDAGLNEKGGGSAA
ncbi:DnaJ domain-containing protein [Methylobacterium phyllosphaerae]